MALTVLIFGTVNAQPSGAESLPSGKSQTPEPRPCPGDLDLNANCFAGKDANGAYYLIAIPAQPNGTLIVHAHGGPRSAEPTSDGSDADLERFSVMVRAGYSWVGSTYRSGGYGVRQAAADVDLSRQIFWKEFGRPSQTILHGQSYGANVAAKLAEHQTVNEAGQSVYDGVLLTSAAVGDRIASLEKLVDTLTVYQFFCDGPSVLKEAGLSAQNIATQLTDIPSDDLLVRVNQCTGADLQAKERSAEQARKLAAILGVIGGSSADLARRVNIARIRIQDVINGFLRGENPFDTMDRLYGGSGDDTALNANIARFSAMPTARDRLVYDYRLSGIILAPTILLHARHDPIVSYETTDDYLASVERTGGGHLFLRLPTSEDQHSKLSESQYLAALSALGLWIESGVRPSSENVAELCHAHQATTMDGCYLEH